MPFVLQPTPGDQVILGFGVSGRLVPCARDLGVALRARVWSFMLI